MSRVELHQGDALAVLRGLPSGSVHCCVTSPPYFGLRDYNLPPTLWGDGWVGCLGLEPTPAQYVEHLVEVFAEVRRVLRDDGSLWLNLGDSYATHRNDHDWLGSGALARRGWHGGPGLKSKDLIGIPWMVAFALRADGWYLRSDIVWAKPNPMPESVADRPTKAHEYLFLLSKSERYYFDQEAVRESHATPEDRRETKTGRNTLAGQEAIRPRGNMEASEAAAERYWSPGGRNIRSVWTIPTQPFSGSYVKETTERISHFATFPPALVEPCIKAGTSERGCCASCGAPWGRVVDVEYDNPGNRSTNGPRSTDRRRHETAGYAVRLERRAATVGWRPACSCPGLDGDHPGSACADEDNWPTKPCTVLDPFGGAGTTAVVACRLGRDSILIDLNADYVVMQERRIVGDAPLFNAVTVVAEQAGGQATIFDAVEVAG